MRVRARRSAAAGASSRVESVVGPGGLAAAPTVFLESAKSLRSRVKARLESVRSGLPVNEVTLHLTDRGLEDLDRTRVVLGDRKKRNVTGSEAVEVLADYFLRREDLHRREPGTRRVGDTRENRSRHVPAEVQRQVRARSGGKCEVPFCDATHNLELAHIMAYRDGGGREASDLFQPCHSHHVAYDAGWFTVEMVDGRPEFHFGTSHDGDRRWPAPPHLRPNPFAEEVARWTWTRPPPE